MYKKIRYAQGGAIPKDQVLSGLASAIDSMNAPRAPQGPGLISGPGGGLEDAIPAAIDGGQAARLSDGEFVVPADVVAMIGDGSTDAGARRLQALIEQVRTMKTGQQQQAPTLSGLG